MGIFISPIGYRLPQAGCVRCSCQGTLLESGPTDFFRGSLRLTRSPVARENGRMRGQRLFVLACLGALLATLSGARAEVEGQPLGAQLRRVVQALAYLGSPLPQDLRTLRRRT